MSSVTLQSQSQHMAWRLRGCWQNVCRFRIFKKASFCHANSSSRVHLFVICLSKIQFPMIVFVLANFWRNKELKNPQTDTYLGLAGILGSWNQSKKFPISLGTWLNERDRRPHLELSPFPGLKSWAKSHLTAPVSHLCTFLFPATSQLRNFRALSFVRAIHQASKYSMPFEQVDFQFWKSAVLTCAACL